MQSEGSQSVVNPLGSGQRKIVAVIGDVMIDRYLNGKVDRISPEAPVPVLLHSDDRAAAGGAANVAVNIAALGCDVRLVGSVGADRDAEDLTRILSKSGISPDSLIVDRDRPTVSKTRIVSNKQQFIRIDRESKRELSLSAEQEIIRAACLAIKDADVVVLSDYAKGVFSIEVLKQIIDTAKSLGRMVLVDPKRRTFEAYRGADVIKPNISELAVATGLPCKTDAEVEVAAKALRQQFDGALLVTRAEAGMSLLRPGRTVSHFGTAALEVADVSGAGDTALAAFAVAIAEGRSIEEAAIWSNFAAGIAVGKFGTAVVSRVELETAIARAKNSVLHPGALVSASAAFEIASDWRKRGDRIVFTNGCFDLVHTGHIELLSAAAREGDRLIVGLNSDKSVQELKGPDRPLQNEMDRARIIGALRDVDLVVIFDEPTPMSLIDGLSPDVLVKGADYTEGQVVGGDLVKSRGGRVVLIPLVAGRSSTGIVKRMKT
jgi:D-beta-D-heptose 7-phosphate kinase/D-beta-D-heptose 1-phosphate adenosyltransferase